MVSTASRDRKARICGRYRRSVSSRDILAQEVAELRREHPITRDSGERCVPPRLREAPKPREDVVRQPPNGSNSSIIWIAHFMSFFLSMAVLRRLQVPRSPILTGWPFPRPLRPSLDGPLSRFQDARLVA